MWMLYSNKKLGKYFLRKVFCSFRSRAMVGQSHLQTAYGKSMQTDAVLTLGAQAGHRASLDTQ